jgi:hypothetical protein
MNVIIIDPFTKNQEIKKIRFTTHKCPREQKKRGDKEPFYYLPSSKNLRGQD